MKRLLSILLIFTSLTAMAQRGGINLSNYDQRLVHFGFTIGLNQMDYVLEHNDSFWGTDSILGIETQRHMGFHLGPSINLQLNHNMDLRFLINLTFGERVLYYTVRLRDANGNLSGTTETHSVNMESTYLEFPLLLKFKGNRNQNFRPYVLAGVNPKYDWAAKKRKNLDDDIPQVYMTKTDLCYDLGAGLEFFLPYFKLGIEVKMSQSVLNTLLDTDDYHAQAIKRMSPQTWMFSLHFE